MMVGGKSLIRFVGWAAVAILAASVRVEAESGVAGAGGAAGVADCKGSMGQLNDSFNGTDWLLEKDPAHPAGPGRWIAVEQDHEGIRVGWCSQTNSLTRPAIIKAGDRVVVEAHSARTDISLEAKALTAAREGEELNVRLRFGSKVLRAFAVQPGKVRLEQVNGARP